MQCNPSLDQWNPAYSVASVLALLHSFLLDPALLYATHRVRRSTFCFFHAALRSGLRSSLPRCAAVCCLDGPAGG